MKARTRYQIAFFALGWLIAIGVLFQVGFGTLLSRALSRMTDRFTAVSQYFSDAEGDAMRRARSGSRSDYLQPLKPTLSSVSALRNPAMFLFGAYDGGLPNTFAGLDQFESSVRYRFPIISFYSAWGDKPDQQFPRRLVESISRMGSVPMITWEPWVVDFDERLRPNLAPRAEREYACLSAIAKGEYDFYVVPWARAAAAFKKPLFLRFAHEMNDPYRYPWGPQNGNKPDDFVAAWQHVRIIFQKMGATNVIWVWSPHISMPWFEYYYPGAEYVDWVGTGVLNYGTVASWSRWWSFSQIMGKAYPVLLRLNKPIMICEFGTVAAGGDVAEWYRQAFYHINHTYSRGVRSVIFFNQPRDATMPGLELNWSPTQSPRAVDLVKDELTAKSAL